MSIIILDPNPNLEIVIAYLPDGRQGEREGV